MTDEKLSPAKEFAKLAANNDSLLRRILAEQAELQKPQKPDAVGEFAGAPDMQRAVARLIILDDARPLAEQASLVVTEARALAKEAAKKRDQALPAWKAAVKKAKDAGTELPKKPVADNYLDNGKFEKLYKKAKDLHDRAQDAFGMRNPKTIEPPELEVESPASPPNPPTVRLDVPEPAKVPTLAPPPAPESPKVKEKEEAAKPANPPKKAPSTEPTTGHEAIMAGINGLQASFDSVNTRQDGFDGRLASVEEMLMKLGAELREVRENDLEADIKAMLNGHGVDGLAPGLDYARDKAAAKIHRRTVREDWTDRHSRPFPLRRRSRQESEASSETNDNE